MAHELNKKLVKKLTKKAEEFRKKGLSNKSGFASLIDAAICVALLEVGEAIAETIKEDKDERG